MSLNLEGVQSSLTSQPFLCGLSYPQPKEPKFVCVINVRLQQSLHLDRVTH